eukprot:sb/3462643/
MTFVGADRVLQRRWKDLTTEDVVWPIVIPWQYREKLVTRAHEVTTGHGGIQSTLNSLRRLFYWPRMESDVKSTVQACLVCLVCAAVNQPRKKYQAELSKFICHEFNAVLVIDHIEPEKKGATKNGFSSILTMTDSFSNYLVAVPTVTQTSLENRQIVEKHWINRFGYPREIVCDQHQGFKGAMFKEYFEVYAGIKIIAGQPYLARSTGRAESSNKRVDDILRKILFVEHPQDWDEFLSDATFVLNNLKNRRTGYTPFRLVHGFEANIPETIRMKQLARTRVPQGANIHAKVHQMAQQRKQLIWKVRQNVNKDFGYAKKQQDKRLNDPELSIGDEVMIRIPCPDHKFSPKYIGPIRIKEVISPYLYRIHHDGKDKVVAVSKLKLFRRNSTSLTPEQDPEPGNASNSEEEPEQLTPQPQQDDPVDRQGRLEPGWRGRLRSTITGQDKRLNDPELSIGDEVMIRIPCPDHKFSPKYIGPIRIKEVISPYLYRIHHDGKDKVVAVSKLKLFRRNSTSLTPEQDPEPGNASNSEEEPEQLTPQPQQDEPVDRSEERSEESFEPSSTSNSEEEPEQLTPQPQQDEPVDRSEERSEESFEPSSASNSDEELEPQAPQPQQDEPVDRDGRLEPGWRGRLRSTITGVRRFIHRKLDSCNDSESPDTTCQPATNNLLVYLVYTSMPVPVTNCYLDFRSLI